MEKAANNSKYRYERKAFISSFTYEKLRLLITLIPFGFRPVFNERQVNSIYLDTFNMSNYRMNMDGCSEREKFRVRWYGKFYNKVDSPILEIKIKHSLLGEKKIFPLSPIAVTEDLSFSDFKNIILKSELPENILYEIEKREYGTIVSYVREYFLSADKKFRITLDREIVMEEFAVNKSRSKFYKDNFNLIFELKYGIDDDDEARKIFSHLPFRMTRNSKYVNAVFKNFNLI